VPQPVRKTTAHARMKKVHAHRVPARYNMIHPFDADNDINSGV